MAALGTIRKRGIILICIIGLGLFAFIAGDMFKSCEGTKAERSQRLAVIAGEKINAQDYQKYSEEFVEFMKMEGQQIPDEQLREAAWNSFMQEKLIVNEAEKLGLTITDDEVNDVMTKGSHPVLAQFPIPQVHNPQTGLFDVNAYRQLVNQTKQANNQQANQIYRYLLFKEHQLRITMLFEKYSNLLTACTISNPAEAKFAFDSEKKESDVLLAAFDYKAINDNDVKVSDAELQQKYDELKESALIKIQNEQRAGKFILVRKVASDQDRAELNDLLTKAASEMDSTDYGSIVRQYQSNISYTGVPVTKSAFSPAVANMVDSIGVNTVKGPFEDAADNTLNVIRVISKTTLPDSIQYRVIGVTGKDQAEVNTRADSVLKAAQGGEDFEVLAKRYGQTAEKNWMVTRDYEHAANIGTDDAKMITMLNEMGKNEMRLLDLAGNKLLIQVLDTKKPVQKYVVAQIKRSIDYSDETSRQITNDLRQFLADNRTLEALEKNAPAKQYQLMDIPGIDTSVSGIANVPNTKEALRWFFNSDRQEGDLSDPFTCGPNQDMLMAVLLTGIYDKGYKPLTDANVNEVVKQEALNDKKAEKILEAVKNVNSIDAAKAVTAVACRLDTVQHVSFANYNQEPKLAGAIAASKTGFNMAPVKGKNGVYFYQVLEQRTLEGAYDEKQYKERAAQRNLNIMHNMLLDELMRDAKLTDNRYIFM